VALERGIPTLSRFFGASLGAELAGHGRRADVLVGNNVLAHVPDLNGFLAGVNSVLEPSGLAVFEFPYLKALLDDVEFDTIYHEHQCYFSVTGVAADRRAPGAGGVRRSSAMRFHGGSLRLSMAHAGTREPTQRLIGLLAEEAAWGVTTVLHMCASPRPFNTSGTNLRGTAVEPQGSGRQHRRLRRGGQGCHAR